MAGFLAIFLSLAVIFTTVSANSHHHHHYYGQVSNNYGRGSVSGQDQSSAEQDKDDQDIYRFAIAASDFGAYAYLDNDGYLRGAFIDLLQNMCKVTNQRCHYMLDDFKSCWKTTGDHEIPGMALLLGAYDACIGISATPERLNSFNFTLPFTSTLNAALNFRKDNVPADVHDLTGRTIGFVNGWALNAKCVRRHKDFNGKFTPLFFDTYQELIEALKSGKVDAALTDIISEEETEFVAAKPSLQCSKGGLAVMGHYGSEVISWWNRAYDALLDKYSVSYLCRKAEERHGQQGKIFCPDD